MNPKDNRSTLRSIISLGKRVWLDCSGCDRSRYLDTFAWIEQHGLDIDTPLLVLGRRIRCTRCGRRTVAVKAEPYSNTQGTDRSQSHIKIAPCPVCGSSRAECSAPIRRPYDPQKAERQFMRHHVMVSCECLDCGNWWTQER